MWPFETAPKKSDEYHDQNLRDQTNPSPYFWDYDYRVDMNTHPKSGLPNDSNDSHEAKAGIKPAQVYERLEQVFDELARTDAYIHKISLPHEFKRIDIQDALDDVTKHISDALYTMEMLGEAIQDRSGVQLFKSSINRVVARYVAK